MPQATKSRRHPQKKVDKILNAVEGGLSVKEASKRFKVDVSSIYAWKKKRSSGVTPRRRKTGADLLSARLMPNPELPQNAVLSTLTSICGLLGQLTESQRKAVVRVLISSEEE